MPSQSVDLAALADLAAQCPEFSDVVQRHYASGRGSGSPLRLKTHIHAADQMLLHSINHFGEVNKPLSQYFNVALQQHHAVQQILRATFDKPLDSLSLLDFACGYGRLLRFLSLTLPPSNIWAAEVQPDAVRFVRDEYGVNGLTSAMDPEAFDPGRRFDFIWVASLFSHLPERLFVAWIRRLHSLLEPQGILAFSLHDECLLPDGSTLPAGGILFRPDSENADLDTCAYGTTHVNEKFVAESICAATSRYPYPYARLRRGLANEQDIYVVPADPNIDLGRLSGFRRGPWGWVDDIDIQKTAMLSLRGWAASLDDGPIRYVKVSLDGEATVCPTGQVRQDVADVLHDPRLRTAGWKCVRQLPSGRDKVFVEVSGESLQGEKALLFAGFVDTSSSTPDSFSTALIGNGGVRALLRRLRGS
jgi:SAM-dependent methyltransferase